MCILKGIIVKYSPHHVLSLLLKINFSIDKLATKSDEHIFTMCVFIL